MTDSGPPKPGEKGGRGLDLGLSSLLGGEEGAPEAQTPTDAEPRIEADPEAVPLSQFEQLAQRSDWGELSTACESAIEAAHGDLLEPRLYWLLAQVRMKAVPASILAAPLDSATRHLLGGEGAGPPAELSEKHRSLAASILSEVGVALRQNGDTVMAVLFLERAYRLNGSSAEELRGALQSEIDNCQVLLRRSGEQSIRNRIATLKAVLAEVGGSAVRPGERETAAVGRRASKFKWPAGAGVAAVVLLVVGGIFAIYLSSGRTLLISEEGVATEAAALLLVPERQKAAPELPVLERLSGLGDLDAVLYELGSGRESRAQRSAPEVRSPREPPRRELVNTTQPLESAGEPELPRRRESQGSRKPRESQQARSDLSREYAPRRNADLADGQDEPAPVGVETFERVIDYELVGKTLVMSKPSRYAVPIYELNQGDRVRAEARVGDWLKLRSRQGRVGYVPQSRVRRVR